MTHRICTLIAIIGATFGLVACSEPPPERSIEEVLAEVEGRPLTGAEVSTLVATADLLCGLDDNVLTKTLPSITDERLHFTDWVFSKHCPGRLGNYTKALPERLPEHVEQGDS